MNKSLIQLAVDLLGFDKVIKLYNNITQYVDIIEIETPCIKYNGVKLLKKFPNNKILADLKTMGAGDYEVSHFLRPGRYL